ncbi:hypothetical protein D9M70_457900 [compost metagenome]
MARNRRDAGLGRELLGGDLVAHRLDRPDRRADEGHAFFFERLGKGGVFREETIARMNGIGAGLADRVDDLVDDDIGLGRRRGADMHRLVRHAHMHGLAVGVGVDRDGGDAELLCGLDDAAGDFTAVGDEDFLEHLLLFQILGAARQRLNLRR